MNKVHFARLAFPLLLLEQREKDGHDMLAFASPGEGTGARGHELAAGLFEGDEIPPPVRHRRGDEIRPYFIEMHRPLAEVALPPPEDLGSGNPGDALLCDAHDGNDPIPPRGIRQQPRG